MLPTLSWLNASGDTDLPGRGIADYLDEIRPYEVLGMSIGISRVPKNLNLGRS